MAEIRVNPTRMELKKLQLRYNTARRGHKLLKDKCDELMKRFLDVVREDKELRPRVEAALAASLASFDAAGAVISPKQLMEALILPKRECELLVEFRNRMSVTVPEFDVHVSESGDGGCNYGFAFTSGELDASVRALGGVLEDMLHMAQLEKEASLLAEEIERTRRRVNALEHIMMPRYLAAMKSIKMKLDENERGNITRLMKVKDMMLAAADRQKYSYIPDEPDEET